MFEIGTLVYYPQLKIICEVKESDEENTTVETGYGSIVVKSDALESTHGALAAMSFIRDHSDSFNNEKFTSTVFVASRLCGAYEIILRGLRTRHSEEDSYDIMGVAIASLIKLRD